MGASLLREYGDAWVWIAFRPTFKRLPAWQVGNRILNDARKLIFRLKVERNNLTVRQHCRRLGRKVNPFSKDRDYLGHQLTLAVAYYHFVIPIAACVNACLN